MSNRFLTAEIDTPAEATGWLAGGDGKVGIALRQTQVFGDGGKGVDFPVALRMRSTAASMTLVA